MRNQVRMRETAEQISAVVEGVFTGVEEVRELVLARHRHARAEGRHLRSADLATLRPALFERLRREDRLIRGTGMVTAPGALADARRWLEWWERSPSGAPRFLEVDLDPDSVDFYDYTAAEWFDVPRRTWHRSIIGPYVDYGGTDEYILTLTVPVASAESFLGVAGADVPAARFEDVVLPLLHGIEAETVLVNEAGRVVASNTARKITGSLLKGFAAGNLRSERRTATVTEAPAQRCAGLPWALVPL